MATQQILTGNLLSDGITYHASDLNAAINNATILPGIIEAQPLLSASGNYKVLASNGLVLVQSTMDSIKTMTLTNSVTVNPFNVAQGVQFSGFLPVTPSGTLNDYNPTGFDKCTVLAVAAVTPTTFTGFQAGPAGTLKIVYNFGGINVTIARENTSSLPNNRFTYVGGAADIVLRPGESMMCIYSTGAGARWVVLCSSRNAFT